MTRLKVLLLLKRSMLDIYKAHEQMQIHEAGVASHILSHAKVMENLADRHRTHEATVQLCKDVLDCRKNLRWEYLMREELSRPIRDVDLVVTVGGDGTLLQASHYLDDSIPVLGVNSDPTRTSEVEEKLEQYDASRSTGHLCAATADTFGEVYSVPFPVCQRPQIHVDQIAAEWMRTTLEVLDDILEQGRAPSELRRISTCVDGTEIGPLALNDILLAHPNPAAVSRCSFSISKAGDSNLLTPPVHCRSSGIRICTAAGSTAAMKSAGGFPMTQQSPDLQYMVREPILPHPRFRDHLHGWVRPKEVLNLRWECRRGTLYFDGSHVFKEIKYGSAIEFSSSAPVLRIFVRQRSTDLK